MNKNLAMWSGPRNLSTAMMYSFAQRSDCTVVDEPYYAAYLKDTGIQHPFFQEVIASGVTNSDQVAADCSVQPESGWVYQKHITKHLLQNYATDWLANVCNVFLIRHPALVINSYHKKDENPEMSDIGVADQWRIYELACATGQNPVVVDSADILANPEIMLDKLCQAIGIDFQPAMLSWPKGPKDYDGPWASHWYHSVWESTGFGAQATEATTEEEKEAVIRFNLQNEERQAAKRLENAKKALAELKAEKAEGAPIPDMVITRLENAIADGKIEDNELKLFNTDDGDMDVTFDDGSKWHPRDNPLTFDGTFDADTTEALNDFLWELKNKAKKANQDPSEFIEEVFNIIPQLMFLLLPLFALLLKVMYIFKKRYYMEHLIVALHSHCFIFLSGILILFSSYLMDEFSGNDLVNGILSWVILAIGLWVPINLFLQQKRIYAQGKIMTTLKFIIVGISYQFLMAITAAAAMVLGLVVI